MIDFTPIVSYRATPDAILTSLVREMASSEPLVIGRQALRVGDVYRLCHSGPAGHLLPREVRLSDDPEALRRIGDGIAKLHKWLDERHVIYGVNTGYGGTGFFDRRLDGNGRNRTQEVLINGLLASGKQDFLPPEIVRGAMLVRVASNFVGVSGLRLEVMQKMIALLNADVVPVVPLKGSLTASGDLVPLAYMAAVLLAETDAKVEVFYRGQRRVAREVLAELGIEPIVLQPKEALALVNGTSVAASAGAMVAVKALNAYFLTVVLTALANCAVRGTLQSYHPFLAEVKPHAGQIYAARLLFNLLHSVSDELLPKDDLYGFPPVAEHRLSQLTYPFRCATQHLAPEYDIILGTFHDLEIEINSVSDNPLILHGGEREFVVSGGNFLGSTVARDMDKMKVSLHSLARLAHAQFKYLVRGVEYAAARTEAQTVHQRFVATHIIPLCSHPADNMGFQGVEIYMDALISEMNQKVGPHSSTYISAEKDNQAIVSMGLAAARTALDLAGDVNYCLAAHLLASCQAFDLTTLPAEEVRDAERRREDKLLDNPRAASLGWLRPVYDFVRRECGIPVLFTSSRLHHYIEPLVRKIENLELLAYLHDRTLRPALAEGAYEEHSSKGKR